MNKTASLQSRIFSVNLIAISATILLALLGVLALTLNQHKVARDQNLMNSARVIARVPLVVDALKEDRPNEELWEFLDVSTEQIGDIDIIAVADTKNTQFYYPDRSLIGEKYTGTVQQRIFDGESAFTSDDTGISGAERCAYAPVLDDEGTLLGFVMVGMYMRTVTGQVLVVLVAFLLIAAVAIWLGSALSLKLSSNIKEESLMGYEPADFLGLFHQREEILEALEEGIVAIDDAAQVIYINGAAAKMLSITWEETVGRHIHEIYQQWTLDRILRVKRPEHDVPLLFIEGEQILSDRMPIWEGGRVIGAVAILRNRTEVTNLAKNLTGVQHMVEAMRAYTHEFMNKLHVILGLLQMGRADKAEEYIMDVTSIHQKTVGGIMKSIENPGVAALLVGKTSRCAELGIRLILGKDSVLHAQDRIIPGDACVTMLGNLIENAIDALNRSAPALKVITVSIHEEENGLFLSVEDTGPGMEQAMLPHIFKRGYTTKKSAEHGTGLALVREVVDAYDGDIRVESELGVGTVFFITFRREQIGGETSV